MKAAKAIVTNLKIMDIYCPATLSVKNGQLLYGERFAKDPSLLYSNCEKEFVASYLETANSVIKQSSTATITGAVIENSIHSNTHAAMYSTVLDNAIINCDFTIDNQLTANSGETFYSHIFGAGANNKDFNFNSGSNLMFDITGNLLTGSLRFQHGAKLYPPTHGSVIFHIGNDFQWNGTMETSDMISAAQRIMVYYYGVIYAKSIVVHQNTKITWVPFVEAQANAVVANVDNTTIQNYTTYFWER